ncbi:hypothetical protein J7T55_013322 [Diaporthe amygdali]|uniref:uncharacterized protein n=1 Tax=Phomopsis amygdali TaxID=1214568 RepID=UPI0022FE8348|nr:uncharacterized protein J7T55_013322 [Diaporthe amygdali]KAJ0119087.1 hypothetical protein J7T55_013322 [Diaporthe amygdali]
MFLIISLLALVAAVVDVGAIPGRQFDRYPSSIIITRTVMPSSTWKDVPGAFPTMQPPGNTTTTTTTHYLNTTTPSTTRVSTTESSTTESSTTEPSTTTHTKTKHTRTKHTKTKTITITKPSTTAGGPTTSSSSSTVIISRSLLSTTPHVSSSWLTKTQTVDVRALVTRPGLHVGTGTAATLASLSPWAVEYDDEDDDLEDGEGFSGGSMLLHVWQVEA